MHVHESKSYEELGKLDLHTKRQWILTVKGILL